MLFIRDLLIVYREWRAFQQIVEVRMYRMWIMGSLKGEQIKHSVVMVLNLFFLLLSWLMLLGETISILGTQCGLANEHNLVTAIDEAGKSSFLKFLFVLMVIFGAYHEVLKSSLNLRWNVDVIHKLIFPSCNHALAPNLLNFLSPHVVRSTFLVYQRHCSDSYPVCTWHVILGQNYRISHSLDRLHCSL